MTRLATAVLKANFTKMQALASLSELERRAQLFFFSKGDLTDEEKKLLGDIDKDKCESAFAAAVKDITDLPVLVVYVPLPPDEDQQKKLGQKARALFGDDLLVELKSDPGLIGGAALVWNGELRDYSLKAKFAEKKKEVREIYKKLLHG